MLYSNLAPLVAGTAMLVAAACGNVQAQPASPSCTQVRLAVLIDKRPESGPQVTADQIASTVPMVARCGGQVAYAVVGDQDQALVRVSVDRPPSVTPSSPAVGAGQAIPAEIEQRNQQNELRDWQQQVNKATDSVKEQIAPLLAKPAMTDPEMWPELRRVDLYFAEPVSPGDTPPQRILLYISDREVRIQGCLDIHQIRSVSIGSQIIDAGTGKSFWCTPIGTWAPGTPPADLNITADQQPSCDPDVLPLTPLAKVVTVKAAPGQAALDCRNPARFEAVPAALNYLTGIIEGSATQQKGAQ